MAQTYNERTYHSDGGGDYPIRISNKSKAVFANDVNVAYTDGNVAVSVAHHGQKRRVGITARGVVIGLPTAPGANTYSKKTFVPVLLKTSYDTISKGDTVTYDGGDWIVLDKVAET